MKQNVHELQNTETKNVRKKSTILLYQALIALIPLVYLYSVWNELPEQVPLHYNYKMEVDRFGSKTEALWLNIFLYAITVGVSAITLFLDKIDPKKRYSETTSVKISWALIVFMTLLSSFIIYTDVKYTQGNSNSFPAKGIEILLVLFFTVLGNFMNNIKPNYFVGVRTPWTLNDEDIWKKTHHLTSKIWFFGGLIMLALILLLPQNYSVFVMLIGLIPLAVVPIAYSYYLFRQKQKNVQ